MLVSWMRAASKKKTKKKTDGMMIPHFLLLGVVVVVVVFLEPHRSFFYSTPSLPLHGMALRILLHTECFFIWVFLSSSCLGRSFWL